MAQMSDLCERLRSTHPELRGDTYWEAIFKERKKAADEIDRLNATLFAAQQALLTEGMAANSLREQLENAKAYVTKSIASYEGDPADNNFQRGFLAALEVVRDEAFSVTDDQKTDR